MSKSRAKSEESWGQFAWGNASPGSTWGVHSSIAVRGLGETTLKTPSSVSLILSGTLLAPSEVGGPRWGTHSLVWTENSWK